MSENPKERAVKCEALSGLLVHLFPYTGPSDEAL
jgi:hypothetical protein